MPIYFSKASAHELFPKWSDEIRAVTSGQMDIKRLVVACEWAGTGDRTLVGARFSAPVQRGCGTLPTSYKMGTGSLPG